MVVVEQHRLFVGGLFNGISQQELEQRFSGYGEVGSVEIISRFDENGDVYKTFGYVDLKTDENNIKRCLRTYNGSKWKGHNLTIQTAKESFQQRLKREREEEKSKSAVENCAKKTKTAKERLQESFSKAGVKDFNLRNAVPGTVIVGEKNWTVTKFGRVVPIVYIRSKTKRKVNKIDPSKHSHALKQFKKDENDKGTDVGLLTWELDAVEDKDVYLKRIGAYHNPVKKKKIHHLIGRDADESKDLEIRGHEYYYNYADDEEEDNNDFEVVSENFEVKLRNQDSAVQNTAEKSFTVYNSSSEDEYVHKNDVIIPKLKCKQNYLQSDQDEEQKKKIFIHESIAKKGFNDISKQMPESTKLINDSDKVYTQKVNITKNIFDKNDISSSDYGSEENESSGNSTDHKTMPDAQVSGYTIFASKDPFDLEDLVLDVNTDSSSKFYYQSAVNPLTKKKMEYIILEPESTKHIDKQKLETKEDTSNEINERKCKGKVTTQNEFLNCHTNTLQADSIGKNIKCAKPPSTNKRTVLDFDGQIEGALDDDDSMSTSSADMDEICSRKVVGIGGEISRSASLSEDNMNTASNSNESCDNKHEKSGGEESNQNFTCDALNNNNEGSNGSDEEEESSNDSVNVESNNYGKEEDDVQSTDSEDSSTDNEETQELKSRYSIKANDKDDGQDESKTSEREDSSSDEDDDEGKTSEREDSSSDEDDDEGKTSEREDSTSDEDDEQPQELKSPHLMNAKDSSSRVALAVKEPKKVLDLNLLKGNPEKQASSNLKRLASMQRKSEVMLDQKKAIQRALSAVDSKEGPAQGRHIVFDSDDDEENKTVNVAFHKTNKSDLKQITKGPSLFESDDEDSEDEDDDSRFQIKPQFEGKSGEKLRKLQEKIGGDSRFTMDKRFLEEQIEDDNEEKTDEEDENEVNLEDEKEKSLSILQGIVGSKGIHSRSKDVQVEKFRFLGKMIRYDPSRDDHSHFEVKTKAKESSVIIQEKLSKPNKVELAQDVLPEVSKEKYFEVSSNIKKAFGNDDQKETVDVERNEGQDSGNCSTQKDSTFRFFGDSDDDQDDIKSANNDIMSSEALSKVNAFDGSKFKFFESSDEEMEDEDIEDKLPMKSNEIEDAETRLCFFFKQNDQRLTDGPLQFYRKEDINNIKQKWQENRSKLMMLSRNRYRKANRQKRQTAQRMKKQL